MDYTEIRVLLERQTVCMEQLTNDVAEIKEALPYKGEERLSEAEKQITHLNKWRYGLVMVGAFILGIVELVRGPQ